MMDVTGYNTRYRFRFESKNGTTYVILLKELGYEGAVIDRALGAAPKLKRENQEFICGTSFEFAAECMVDQEYSILFTESAQKFLVTLDIEGVSSYSDHLFIGFVTPELYSEPVIAPPYNVSIVATDGLGELKISQFSLSGRATINEILSSILTNTGISDIEIDLVNTLQATTPTLSAANLLNLEIDLTNYVEQKVSNYDVLQKLMSTIGALIYQQNGRWMICRRNEVVSGNVVTAYRNGLSVTLPHWVTGSVPTSNYFPIGSLKKEIVPAKSAMSIVYKFDKKETIIDNGLMLEDRGWIKENAAFSSQYKWYYLFGSPYNTAGISLLDNSFVVEEGWSGNAKIKINVACCAEDSRPTTSGYVTYNENPSRDFAVKIKRTYENVVKWFNGKDWVDYEVINNTQIPGQQFQYSEDIYVPRATSPQFLTVEYTLPFGIGALGNLPSPESTIEIYLINKYNQVDTEVARDTAYYAIFAVESVLFTLESISGYQNNITIDNSAREKESNKEINFGDAPFPTEALKSFYSIITVGGVVTSGWSDRYSSGTFFNVVSKDYALYNALPKLRMSGIMNVARNSIMPAAISDGTLFYEILEYTWNLYNDEFDVNALSTTIAQIESITVDTQEYKGGSTSSPSSSSTGSGSSGGSGGAIGTTNHSALTNRADANSHPASAILVTTEEEDDAKSVQDKIDVYDTIINHLQLIDISEEDTPNYVLQCDLPITSLADITAFGISGEEDTPGLIRLDTFEGYDDLTMGEYVLSAHLGYDINTRLTTLEENGVGTELTADRGLSIVNGAVGHSNSITSVARGLREITIDSYGHVTSYGRAINLSQYALASQLSNYITSSEAYQYFMYSAINKVGSGNVVTDLSVEAYQGSYYRLKCTLGNIDLSSYITQTQLTTALGSYVTQSALNTALSSYVTSTQLSNTLAGYAQDTDLANYLPISNPAFTGTMQGATIELSSMLTAGTLRVKTTYNNTDYLGAITLGYDAAPFFSLNREIRSSSAQFSQIKIGNITISASGNSLQINGTVVASGDMTAYGG